MDEMIRTREDEPLTGKQLTKWINIHLSKLERYERLQAYYEGRHRDGKRKNTYDHPDYQITNPFPRYITDMNTSYVMSNPVVYTAVDLESEEDNKLLDKLTEIFRFNNEHEENINQAKTCGIKGKSYELLWVDEENNIRFGILQPDEIFLVHDNTLNNKKLYAVRTYIERVKNKDTRFAEVWDKEKKTVWRNEGNDYQLLDDLTEYHYFRDVPVVLWENNTEHMCDFEHVLSLIDAYDLTQSNTLNDMSQFTNAYLVLENYGDTDSEDVEEMKKNRVLLLDEDGDARWLIKDVNDQWVENYKDRLKEDIHKFSFTPDMSDDNFAGTASGVSLKYKLMAMEQLRASKERKFKTALMERIRLICNILQISEDVAFNGIEITFDSSLPQNVLELTQVIQNLSPFLSKESLISLLPFVTDAGDELQKREDELDTSEDYNELMKLIDKRQKEHDEDKETEEMDVNSDES